MASSWLYIGATLVWLVCAYQSWRWAREARRYHESARQAFELAEQLVRDHRARMGEWVG